MEFAKKWCAMGLAGVLALGQAASEAQQASLEEYAETVYVVEEPEAPSQERRSWWPWIVGGALAGAGSAAILIHEESHGRQKEEVTTTDPTTCSEVALLGTWHAETIDNNRTAWYAVFRSGGRADFERITDVDNPNASLVELHPGIMNAWTLDTNTCIVTVNSPISGQSGSGPVADRTLTVAGKIYQKR